MGKYRKKPVEVEAWQWKGGPEAASIIIDHVLKNGGTLRYHSEFTETEVYADGHEEQVVYPEGIAVDTLEGTMMASPGDFIIKGVAGEYYPCKPDIFEASYDQVVDVGV